MSLDAYATFLTARWDEIEREASDYHHAGYGSVSSDGCSGCGTARAIRADLAAKRAILADAMYDHDRLVEQQALPEGDLNMLYLLQVRNDVNKVTLEHLAAPFRDHPDHPASQEA